MDEGKVELVVRELEVIRDAFKGDVVSVLRNVPDLVIVIERLGQEWLMAGPEKKELAVAVLDRIVKISWLHAPIKKLLFSLAVEVAVAVFNKSGHAWLDKLGF